MLVPPKQLHREGGSEANAGGARPVLRMPSPLRGEPFDRLRATSNVEWGGHAGAESEGVPGEGAAKSRGFSLPLIRRFAPPSPHWGEGNTRPVVHPSAAGGTDRSFVSHHGVDNKRFPRLSHFILWCLSVRPRCSIGLLTLLAVAVTAAETPNGSTRPLVRDHYVDVTAYPDYHRRPWPMPGWKTFDDTVQLVGDRYVNAGKLKPGGTPGTVFRPNYDFITGGTAKNFAAVLDQLKEAKPPLFVWNLGGYIWWMHPGGYVHYDRIEQLKSVLGERFLGCDIGEQEGHYVNGYRGLTRLSMDPFEEFWKLHAIQQRIAEDHADKSTLLTVMYHWHDSIRDGLVTSAAAECQNRGGVASAQVQYAFLRGAARQFGVTLAGDVSVFSSWAKVQTSTALRRRLLYSQFQWNCAILSCEDAYGPDPIVVDFNRWMQGNLLKTFPRPGPMHCPVALLTDPFQGWMPAQTHVGQFEKHGFQPYGPGDFLTHHLLNLVYPRYHDNGMWKDESRALVPTPYGDEIEVVTSDCALPILHGYGVVIVASDLPAGGTELRDKLESYVAGGGRLVITAANARRLWPEWHIGTTPEVLPAGATVKLDDQTITEPLEFEVLPIDPAAIPGAKVVASANSRPVACNVALGKGVINLLASPYGIHRTPRKAEKRVIPLWKNDAVSSSELLHPYELLAHVRAVFDGALKSQRLFNVANDQLAFIVNRLGPASYMVGIYNSHLTRQPFAITSLTGNISRQREIPLDDLAQKYGFLPKDFSGDSKPSDANHVAGGEVRLFQVEVAQAAEAVRNAGPPVFVGLPSNRFVRMPTLPDLARSLVRWPTFFQHCDGVLLDWDQIRDVDEDALRYDGCRWLNRQRVRFVIDCRPGQQGGSLALDNRDAAAKELAGLQNRLRLLDGARDLLFSAATASEVDAIARIATDSAWKDFTFHVLPTADAARTALGAGRLQVRTACTAGQPTQASADVAGLLLLTPGAAIDHARSALYPGIQVLDASYENWDALYADIRMAWERPAHGTLAGHPVVRTPLSGTATPLRQNLYLSLRDPGSVERALRTFDPAWRECAGVKLESQLVWWMSADACRRLGQQFKLRRLRVMVDFCDHLNGWNGLTFQDLSAWMKTPEIGNQARSLRVFENVGAKLPLLGATDVLFVISPSIDFTEVTGKIEKEQAKANAEAKAARASFERFCAILTKNGATGHLWHRPYREQRKMEDVLALVQGNKDLRLALNLNTEPDAKKEMARAGDRLGIIVLGGGTFAVARRNAIISSDNYGGMMYAPLSLRAKPLPSLPETVPWVLDGDYRDANEVAADVRIVSSGK